jgi:hypothetical protein
MWLVKSQRRTERKGGLVKKASKRTIVAAVLFFVSIWLVMSTGITAGWLTEQARVFGLVMLPAVIVAGLMVAYFEWRAKVLGRIRDERYDGRRRA